MDIDCVAFAFFAQRSEPKSTESIQDIVYRIYPQTVKEALGFEIITKLVDHKFHAWCRSNTVSNARFVRYALFFIIRYLGLQADEDVCSYYHIAEDLPELNMEAHQLYKQNLRFRDIANKLVDGIEEFLDTC